MNNVFIIKRTTMETLMRKFLALPILSLLLVAPAASAHQSNMTFDEAYKNVLTHVRENGTLSPDRHTIEFIQVITEQSDAIKYEITLMNNGKRMFMTRTNAQMNYSERWTYSDDFLDGDVEEYTYENSRSGSELIVWKKGDGNLTLEGAALHDFNRDLHRLNDHFDHPHNNQVFVSHPRPKQAQSDSTTTKTAKVEQHG